MREANPDIGFARPKLYHLKLIANGVSLTYVWCNLHLVVFFPVEPFDFFIAFEPCHLAFGVVMFTFYISFSIICFAKACFGDIEQYVGIPIRVRTYACKKPLLV